MRYTLLIFIVVLGSTACKKDKFTTAPQIKYKSVKPSTLSGHIPIGTPGGQAPPIMTIHVTDSEGDIGFVDNADSAYIFVKNLLANTKDSFKFPDLRGVTGKNFECDVDINLTGLMQQGPRPAPKTDSLYFEIYVKDFAKNKSNTIVSGDPVLFVF